MSPWTAVGDVEDVAVSLRGEGGVGVSRDLVAELCFLTPELAVAVCLLEDVFAVLAGTMGLLLESVLALQAFGTDLRSHFLCGHCADGPL